MLRFSMKYALKQALPQTYRKVVQHESKGEAIQWDLKFDDELQQDDPDQHKENAEPRKCHVSVNDLGVLQQHQLSVLVAYSVSRQATAGLFTK